MKFAKPLTAPAFRLEWKGKRVFAKWDELPNPLVDDLYAENGRNFRAEFVPNTFYLPLTVEREYEIPIIVRKSNNYEVFSGWWFGKGRGYGPDPTVTENDKIIIRFYGETKIFQKTYKVKDIIKKN